MKVRHELSSFSAALELLAVPFGGKVPLKVPAAAEFDGSRNFCQQKVPPLAAQLLPPVWRTSAEPSKSGPCPRRWRAERLSGSSRVLKRFHPPGPAEAGCCWLAGCGVPVQVHRPVPDALLSGHLWNGGGPVPNQHPGSVPGGPLGPEPGQPQRGDAALDSGEAPPPPSLTSLLSFCLRSNLPLVSTIGASLLPSLVCSSHFP